MSKKDHEEKTLKVLQKVADDFDFDGKGSEIIFGKGPGKYIFSSKNEKMKISNKLNLKVEVSSVEQENDQLLHSLL